MHTDPEATNDPVGKWAIVGAVATAAGAFFRFFGGRFAAGSQFKQLTDIIEKNAVEARAHRQECTEGFAQLNQRLLHLEGWKHDEVLTREMMARLRAEHRNDR